jgi:hypothetical protein
MGHPDSKGMAGMMPAMTAGKMPALRTITAGKMPALPRRPR